MEETASDQRVYVFSRYTYGEGARGGAIGWSTTLQVGRWWIRFPMAPLESFVALASTQALNRYEYQEYFRGG
jgi:hypothetical protein